jgi:Holliday junction resolvasome RuvABC DNA-binding subunit
MILDNTLNLKDIGVTNNESSSLQKIASIPKCKFEEILQTADRKCGEWLQDNIKVGGDRKSEKSKSNVSTLINLGVTRDESSRLQKIASIPESKFEEILQTAEAGGRGVGKCWKPEFYYYTRRE